jgi:hypothetical protein
MNYPIVGDIHRRRVDDRIMVALRSYAFSARMR